MAGCQSIRSLMLANITKCGAPEMEFSWIIWYRYCTYSLHSLAHKWEWFIDVTLMRVTVHGLGANDGGGCFEK